MIISILIQLQQFLTIPKLEHVKFIGSYHCGRIWEGWGVTKGRIIVVKPGDTIELKDMKIHSVESFDRTCLVTIPVNGADETGGELAGLAVTDEEMAQKAVNYVFETPGGLFIMVQILTSQTILGSMIKTSKLMLL